MYSNEVGSANIDDLNSEFSSIFKRSLGKGYNILRQPFHRDWTSVFNNMMVTYEVSYSHSNDSDEFLWTWKIPASVNP